MKSNETLEMECDVLLKLVEAMRNAIKTEFNPCTVCSRKPKNGIDYCNNMKNCRLKDKDYPKFVFNFTKYRVI